MGGSPAPPRNSISERIPVWWRNAALISCAFWALMPRRVASFSGWSRSTFRDSSPNFPTISAAVAGPMPLMTRLER